MLGMKVEMQTEAVEPVIATDPSMSLLHRFEVRWSGRIIALPLVAQRLLVFLALSDRPQPRSHVAGALWPDTDERHASANLRSSIWRVGCSRVPLLSVGDHSLRLHARVKVDLWDAHARAALLFDPSTPDTELGADPVSLFVEDVLPDWCEDWALVERERFRQVRLHALEALCDRFTDAGRIVQAIEAGLAAVAADPLRESAHRSLIRAHLKEGNRSEAIRQFQLCSRLLDEELGVQPSAELARVVEGIA
jgi:DNA-binding SARP family transcriptional activator